MIAIAMRVIVVTSRADPRSEPQNEVDPRASSASSTVSREVSSGNNVAAWKVRPRPTRARLWDGSDDTSATTDTLLLVNGGRVAPFDGDLDDYRDWVLALRRRTDTDIARDDAPDRKAVKRAEAQARQKRADARKPLVAKRAKLEEEIRGLEAEKRELDTWLATPEAYADEAKERLKPAVERSGGV